MHKKKKLGELLLEAGIIDEMQLHTALVYQTEWGGKIGTLLLRKGFISEEQLFAVMEKKLGIPCVYLDNISGPSDEILKMVTVDIARKFAIFPLNIEGKNLVIATSDPVDLKTLDDISFLLGVTVKPVFAPEADISRAIDKHYEGRFGIRKSYRVGKGQLKAEPSEAIPFSGTGPHASEFLVSSRHDRLEPMPKAEASPKELLEGLIDLLVKKGVITKDELMDQIKAKRQT